MERLRNISFALLLAAALGAAYWLGRISVEVHEEVRCIPVYYERPEPFRVTARPVTVAVPRVIFAPGDTLRETLLVPGDSIRVEIAHETREYRDSAYCAQVSGPAVGGMHPQLDRLEIYAAERIQRQVVREPWKWEAGPAAGTGICNGRGTVWLGAYARRTFGRVGLSAAAGYDVRNGKPVGIVQVDVAVWRR